MASRTKVILLACGSFNPITNMHLRLFELSRDFLHATGKFEVVEGIVSPVHDDYGKKGLISAQHRINMAQLALNSSDWIRLDRWETQQKAWTPSCQVLKHFQAEASQKYFCSDDAPVAKRSRTDVQDGANMNERTDLPSVKLLCGADLLESFAVPDLWSEQDMLDIVSKQGVVCVSRADTDPRRFVYESDLLHAHRHNIHMVTEWITNDISSTKIRRSISRGESVRYLIQDEVIRYIHEHELYGHKSGKKPALVSTE